MQHPALYFETPLDFCDFVRLQGAEAHPATGDFFEIVRVVHPANPGQSAVVLLNFKSSLRNRFFGSGESIKAEISADEKSLTWSRGDEALPVIERRLAKTLVECVAVAEWSKKRAETAGSGPVFFWVHDEKLVAELIRDSLQLGNDRIQYGPLANGSSPAGRSTTLLRIERPSFYLLQQCAEEHPDSVTIYYPEAEDLFVVWGKEHPLREWWQRSDKQRTGDWVFFTGDTDFCHVAPVVWQDAYDLTELELDFAHRDVWTKSPESPPRFEVPLRLVKKAADAADPELWLLDEPGQRQLENTLQLADDDSLRVWQIAVQKLESDTSRDWVLIREARTKSKGGKHHDFGGTAFARFRGINDLLLPVGYEIQPPLRRDAYRQLFDLQPGFLTVLVPEMAVSENGHTNESAFLVLRVSERAFDSLSTFVDYLVERNAAELEDLMQKSVFDFKHYLKAPKHPGLTSGQRQEDDGNRKKAVAGLSDLDPGSGQKSGDALKTESNSLLDRLEKPAIELDESALGDIEREELEIERELVTSGQSLELWCDLLVCKNKLGKTADAVICTIEALWLANGTMREEPLRETLLKLSTESIENEAATITVQDTEWARRAAACSMALNAATDNAADMDRWTSEVSAFLRELDGGLRAKERWLLWGEILKENRDVRREAQLREEIRDRIAERGLSLEETPSFLRSRIFLDRKVGGGQNGRSDSQAETAVANLAGLWSIAKLLRSDRLLLASKAVLARAFSNVGDVARAQEMIVNQTRSKDTCAKAWEAMFRIEALRGIDLARAEALDQEMESMLEAADPETARAIGELRETYKERGDADNPAAFLARENRGRTYPTGAGTQEGPLYELSMRLEKHVSEGNEAGAVSVMRSMMTLEDKSDYDHSVKLPQFVETLVAGLERFKWGERGASLIPLYEEFTDRAAGYITEGSNFFYGSILHSNLAHGLLIVENLEKALHQINLATDAVLANGTDLDFIDSAASLIRTIEQLPLSHREPVLIRLMSHFRGSFDQSSSPYLVNERLFAVVAKLLDQMAEAASSKDKLSLQQFRSYQLQDEFLILQRVQTESFCAE